jgi:uncharacterized protein
MKWSKYNTVIPDREQYVLYNTLSDKIMVFVKEIKVLLDSYMNDIDKVETIHPSLFKYLQEEKFIVPDHFNETEYFIDSIKRQDNSTETFHITINPTLNCNLNCWYCYEKHQDKTHVSDTNMLAIKALIQSKAELPELKSLALNFFGGEPLMEIKKTVLPVIRFADSLCRKHEKTLEVHFTSNAVLLTPAVSDMLADMAIKVSFQVPFDGDRERHNSIKKFLNGKGSYDITLNNIRYALSKGIEFNIRCNYDENNIRSFEGLINDFQDIFVQYSPLVRFSMQQIWQAKETKELIHEVNKTHDKLKSLNISSNRSGINTDRCYADKENCIVINYNGDIYKCTARDFKPEIREGILNPDGTVTYNERYHERMNIKYNNKTCYDCVIFPVCTTCTQKHLDNPDKGICTRRISEKDREFILRHRIKAISTNELVQPE